MFAAVEIIADAICNSTLADSEIDVARTNILQELQVSFSVCTDLCF